MNATTMTRKYAELYAAALLIGAEGKSHFEVSFANSLDTVMIALALQELGCNVQWDRFHKFLIVNPPANWREHVA